MRVNEIFNSIEGEGIRAGELTTFVRLAGCNLKCGYCDTDYAQAANAGQEMTPEDVAYQVIHTCIGSNVTITGGEPLIHDGVDRLIVLLVGKGFHINIETNGSVDFRKRPWARDAQVFCTVDYKCPSSGQEDKMSLEMFGDFPRNTVVKFVVGSKEDLDRARMVVLLSGIQNTVYLSPVFGKIEASEIVEYMKENHLIDNWRVQLQLHKFIWDPNKRGV